MDLATAIIEAAVGVVTLAAGLPFLRGGGATRHALGVLLLLAGVAAIGHAAGSALG